MTQQAQPAARCKHGETSYHDWDDDGPHDTPFCPGPQQPQNDTLRSSGDIAVWIVLLAAAVWAAIAALAVIHAIMTVSR